MTESPRRVAVIGVGTMGAQAMWRCAARGAEVVGFDQYIPGHDRGAAGGESRIFRSAHFEDTRYVPLLQLADRYWRQLADETGCNLRSLVGCAIMGPHDHPQMEAAIRSAQEHGLRHKLFETTEARRAFPQFHFNPDDQLLLDEYAGFIRPELTIRTAVRRAREFGAVLKAPCPITAIEPRGAVVDVHTKSGERLTFDAVIVSPGPWINGLMPLLDHHVETRRPISAWYLPKQPETFSNGPAFIRTGPKHFYGVPSLDGYGVKLGVTAEHHQLVPNADELDVTVTEDDLRALTEMIAEYLPHLDPAPIRTQAYMEAYTRDRHPIVGLAPGTENVVVLGSFSGHGFKLAPAMGEIGADLAIDGRTQHPIGVFDPQRLFTSEARSELTPTP